LFDGPQAEPATAHSHAVPASFAFFPDGHGRQQWIPPGSANPVHSCGPGFGHDWLPSTHVPPTSSHFSFWQPETVANATASNIANCLIAAPPPMPEGSVERLGVHLQARRQAVVPILHDVPAAGLTGATPCSAAATAASRLPSVSEAVSRRPRESRCGAPSGPREKHRRRSHHHRPQP